MKYLIVKDWYTTHGNHAGMVHMCKMLVNKYPTEYCMYIMPEPWQQIPIEGNFLFRILKKVRNRIVKRINYGGQIVLYFLFLIIKLKKSDRVFLLEYIEPAANQWLLAKVMHKLTNARLYGMAHQTPTKFEHVGITPKEIKLWVADIDKVLTLGSSLSNYLREVGISKEKISTGFHYVDIDYYSCLREPYNHQLTVIMMGMTQRNYKMLASIVKECTDVNWVICRGKQSQVDEFFEQIDNVSIKGYLSEPELRDEMAKADVSISVMEDTVGSNVITTSLSMGLVNVASDVGSIRDYCDEKNSLLCKNSIEDFVNAILYLRDNPVILKKLQKNAVDSAKRFNIENIHLWFSSIE